MGAQRDAEELKEHPFFKTIDWKALALKQVTPPFKPVVESDESVANFDPEFTSADLREAGLDPMDLDEEDPSEDWVALSASLNGSLHTPNGPLGSDRPERPANGPSKGIQIASRKRDKNPAGSPLTSSLQDNFRGFTYHGESLVVPGTLTQQSAEEEQALQESQDPTTDDDDEAPVGRYAKKRGDNLDPFDDDMHI